MTGGLGGLGGMSNTNPNNPYNVQSIFQGMFDRPADAGAMEHYGQSGNTGVGLQREIALGAWNSGQDRGSMLQRAPADYYRAWMERAGRGQSQVNQQTSNPFISSGTNQLSFRPVTGIRELLDLDGGETNEPAA